jgi:hypothetical protein
MSLYKHQSLLTITLETNYASLASAEVTKILYEKPDGEKGFWNASVSGTKLVYNLANGDININGHWKFQSYIEVGGLKGLGVIVSKQFDIPLL